MNTYKALSKAAEAAFSVGVFEREFSPTEERDWLASGLLELVPRPYRVLSGNYERPQGDKFEAAFPVELEQALIQGGHIERVDDGDDGDPSSFKETTADGGSGGKAANKNKKED